MGSCCRDRGLPIPLHGDGALPAGASRCQRGYDAAGFGGRPRGLCAAVRYRLPRSDPVRLARGTVRRALHSSSPRAALCCGHPRGRARRDAGPQFSNARGAARAHRGCGQRRLVAPSRDQEPSGPRTDRHRLSRRRRPPPRSHDRWREGDRADDLLGSSGGGQEDRAGSRGPSERRTRDRTPHPERRRRSGA